MTGRRLRLIVTAVALGALLCGVGSAGTTANRCAEGGRPRPDEGGIGGTGARPVAPGDDDGIGGTGIRARAESGLIGTITGFASVCVGGTEVHYDADTPVRIDGLPARARDLAVGQVVEVVADGSGAELHAREIDVRHVVIGPVTRADLARGEISVAGQTVLVSSATPPDAAAVRLDMPVEVSGMRRADGAIVASRIAPAATGDLVELSGPVSTTATGTLAIAGTPIEVARPTALAAGDEVRVVGRWMGAGVRAKSLEPLPRLPFDGRVSRVTIEGFANEAPGGQLRVGSFMVDVPPDAGDPFASPNVRLRVEGLVQDRRVVIDRLEPMDELPVRPPRPGGDGRTRGDDGGAGRGPHDGPATAPPRSDGAPRDDAGGRPFSAPPQIRDAVPPDRPPTPERPARPDSARPERPAERPERPPERPAERPAERPERPPERPERPPRFERPPR